MPEALPTVLPDDWRGGLALIWLVFVMSAFLDNIAAAMIGGAASAAGWLREAWPITGTPRSASFASAALPIPRLDPVTSMCPMQAPITKFASCVHRSPLASRVWDAKWEAKSRDQTGSP